MAAAERQQELFADPLEPRVLPRGGWPFWTLNVRGANGGMSQRAYRLSQMDWVLRNVRKDVDTYMSQGFFAQPCRRALHLAWLTHAYVDLDFYKLPVPPNPGTAGIWLRTFCDDEGIPEPSLIVFSGRGVYLKWLWSSPLPRAAAGRAVAVNRALVKRFAAWGADPAAVDVSRVLRVVGTTNTKTGDEARVLWQAEREGKILTYDFELLAEEVLPFSLEQIRGFRQAAEAREADVRILSQERAKRRVAEGEAERRSDGRRAFVPEDWHWGVIEDLRTLAKIRHGGTVPRGEAAGEVGVDLFAHIGACQLARVIHPTQLWNEIQSWARIIMPREYVEGPLLKRQSATLLRLAHQAAAGQAVDQGVRKVTPVYTYRASTMIERLRITPDEERQMTRLIGTDEKRRRDREAWRSAHTGLSRDEWLSQNSKGREKPWEAEGISRASWFRRQKAAQHSAQPGASEVTARLLLEERAG